MRFLIIDDSSADRELIIQRLRKDFANAEFVQVSLPEDFERIMACNHFDVILTDYQLNWSNGLEVLNTLKQRFPDIPIVMVTGTGNEEIAVEGLRSGLSNYILKQHLDQLPHAVRESLEKAHLHRQYEEAIKQLRFSEERYREIFEHGLTAIFVATPQGRLLACNPAFARIFGYQSVAEMLRAGLPKLYVHADDYQSFVNLLKEKKHLEYHEAQMMRRGGEPIYVVGNIKGTFSDTGELIEIEGYLFDNTEQKKLAEQLQQAQRLESVGLLVSGIAHDFNNMLSGILGYTHRGMSKITATHPLYDHLRHIREISSRAARMTHQLLAFSRRQVLEPIDVNLNVVVENLLSFFGKIISDQVEIQFIPDTELATVHVDYAQIEQVLINLCINARDAMPQGGKITIRTSNVSPEKAQKLSRGQLRAVPHILLSIHDMGIGMNEQTRARIFEPFFTTKEVGKGTGLGLSMVHGIIGQHNGFIDVSSRVGQGTTFSIYLPSVKRVPDSVEPAIEIPTPAVQSASRATILVVEDDPDIRYLLEDSLGECGYVVISAPDGVEGLKIYQQEHSSISLIISDLVTPRMNGKELYERVIQINRAAKFLFVSGYQANQISHNFVLEEGFAFLPKPFDLDELAARVQDLLIK